MAKKFIFMSLAPVLAVAAFAVMPAMASAATEYGTCPTKVAPATSPPCNATYKLAPFTEGETWSVAGKKVASTAAFQLVNEEKTAGLECGGYKTYGFDVNVGGVGTSRQTLFYSKCKGILGLAGCVPNNGTTTGGGPITGEITTKLNGTEEEDVSIVAGGFQTFCVFPGPVQQNLGGVTGLVKGKRLAPPKGQEVEFNETPGLKFAGKNATITGTVETSTVMTKKKIY